VAHGAVFDPGDDGRDGEDGDRRRRAVLDWRAVLAHPGIAVHVDAGGRASLLRPDVLVVDAEDLTDERLVANLDDLGVDRGAWEESRQQAERTGLGFGTLRLGTKVDPVGATRFLQAVEGRRPLRVGPDHLLWPMQGRVFGPAMPPRPVRKPIRKAPAAEPTVPVAVIDSGVVEQAIGTDPLLGASSLLPIDPSGLDPMWDAASATLAHWTGGHGTHVAGVVAAASGGTARVWHRSVCTLFGDLPLVADTDVAAAIAEAVARGCRVVNLSLGGPTALDLGTLASATTLARSGDVVAVAAAGNEATTQPMYPAAAKRVIGVGAVRTDGRGRALERAPFSNHGTWVDCAAAGVDVVGPYVTGLGGPDPDGHRPSFKGWASWSGTSFAAPFVAGRIAAAIAGGIGSARVAAATVLAGGTGLDPAWGVGVQVR
jgi:hypothetical protein